MAYITTARTWPLSPDEMTQNMGISSPRGGIITLDQDFTYNGNGIPEMCKILHIGIGGNFVWVNIDGVPLPYFNAASGSIFPFPAVKILSSYNFGGSVGTVTTTASDLVWYGGK